MTTTPARKHSICRRRGCLASPAKRKALRRRGLRAFRCWQHLTRCFAFFHRRTSVSASSMFWSLRHAFGTAFLALWLPAVAQADTFTVTNNSDLTDSTDGQTTLREAIALANDNPGPDIINFDPTLSGDVITLTQGQLAISDDLSIDASNLAQAPVIDADGKSRVMHFTATEGDLSLTKLTLRNGWTNSIGGNGGGVLFDSAGVLTLTNSTLSGNSVHGWLFPGGGLYASGGGGISTSTGSVILTNSTLKGNSASWSGGGISTGSGAVILTNSTLSGNVAGNLSGGGGSLPVGGGGGIFTSSGSVTLTNSTLSGNSTGGRYLSGGGVYTFDGAVTLTNSTLSGNHAYERGGGIHTSSGDVSLTNSTLSRNFGFEGGGIHTGTGAVTLANSTLIRNSAMCGGGIFGSGAVTLTNSTLSGNHASWCGGGIHNWDGDIIALSNSTLSGNHAYKYGGGIFTYRADISLTNSTLSENSGYSGGGIFTDLGSLTLTNSIIAGNSGIIGTPDIRPPQFPATQMEVSHCLIGDTTGARLDEAKINLNNLIDVDPLLEPLASNGGPTQTHALGIGSPAIDQGHATGVDQRGVARVDNPAVPNAEGGNGSDIGAYERSIPFIVSDPSDVTDGDFSPGKLSLREALTLANDNPGPDIINFDPTLSGDVITLTQGELAISDDLSIDASNLPNAPVIDADQKSRVMNFTAAAGDLLLTKLTLRNGSARTFSHEGGGIFIASSGSLTLTDSNLSGNSAGFNGGGIHARSASVTLTHSTVRDNFAEIYGGGISAGSGAVTLTNSTLSRNSTSTRCGPLPFEPKGGGIFSGSGPVTLSNSTLSGSSSAYGGGIFTGSGAVTITNSTLSGNFARSSRIPPISNPTHCRYPSGGGIFTSGAVTLTNATLSGNSAGHHGGGIHARGGSLTLTNSIIAGNSDNGTAPDILPPDDPATQLEVFFCLIGDSSGARLDEAKVNLNNLTDLDPLLAPLADNGGPTPTMLTLPGSPVINAGTPDAAPASDQRGFVRVGLPDIGAAEYQGRSDLGRVFEVDNDGDGNPFGIEQALGTDPFRADPGNPRNLTAPTFNAEGQPVLSFGVGLDAAPGTLWILERSTDLEVFEEIYRFDGTTDFVYPEFPVGVETTATGATITDQAPPPGRAYYRFRASLADPG